MQPRLVWQDDPKRQGMSRRGPKRSERPSSIEPARLTSDVRDISRRFHVNCELLGTTSRLGINPPLAFLSSNESILLDHYIQRFSRTYPTCQEPTNPFLSLLLPFALQHPIVLDALLAVSGAQHWQSDSMTMEDTTLQLRHRALRGCRTLLNQSDMKIYMETQAQSQSSKDGPCISKILSLVACCVLLLLYEKLVGNGKLNWMPHLSFLASLFERLFPAKGSRGLDRSSSEMEENQVFQFLYSLFLYNDLVHSTATGTTTLSDYYLTSILSTHLPQHGSMTNRYYYPCLIAQIAADNATITDTDIDAWDGRLDWLPSFSSTCHTLPGLDFLNETDERVHAIQLYRYTAKILLRQSIQRGGHIQVQDAGTSILAERAVACLSTLPEGSSFENALLWPISICARELTHDQKIQRKAVMQRLQQLERRFHMRHFRRMQEVLEATWSRIDQQSAQKASRMEEDSFLLG